MANLFSEKPIVKVVMLKGQDGEEKLINQADGSGVSLWIGTQAEYDAIPEAELVEDCIYYITDDTRDDFNTRLNELDTKVDNNTTKLSSLNKTLWTGAVNDSSTAEEKLLSAPGVETYNLLAFVVSRYTNTDTEDITILAYKNNGIKFVGYNNDELYVQATAGAVLTTSSGNIVNDKIQFSYAQVKIGTGDTQNVYLKKIIGVM